MTIYFYRERDAYGFLSNFSAHGVTLKGRYWPTTEHYFQAMKFEGTPHEEEVRAAPSPKRAKELGGDRARPRRPDWDSARDGVMKEALRAKFTQHQDLRDALLATGDETLVEDAPRDFYWGCGRDRTGKNRLGALLMEVRKELREGT
ncbi:MAG: NADAR family protein [Deltaproteobacteria bacterium]|nr:NADAR family protein [Deltaproteobacteria bacterium]